MKTDQDKKLPSFLQALGPGLLFAGMAVGVSHLMQSTRAGALYGITAIAFVLFAHFLKYPAIRFGTQYAAATGQSLLHAYRNMGKSYLIFYGIVLAANVLIGLAAISLVTGMLLKIVFDLPYSVAAVSITFMLIAGLFLKFGHFSWLDRINKVLVLVLTVATLGATAIILPQLDISSLFSNITLELVDIELKQFFFLAALIGWMPTSVEVSVVQSLWSTAKAESVGNKLRFNHQIIDFNIGFIGSVVLAICFVIMGTVMVQESSLGQPGLVGIAKQLIDLYYRALGDFAGTIVSFSAVCIMATTALTVLDSAPRGVTEWLAVWSDNKEQIGLKQNQIYDGLLSAQILIAIFIILFFMSSITSMVDLVTTIAFLSGPILAYFNHRAVNNQYVELAMRPSALLKLWSLISIVLMATLALCYLGITLFI